MVFSSIFLENDGTQPENTQASNMLSNVSLQYNAGDTTQRNAVYQAQSKISKAQKRKEASDLRKQKYGIKTESIYRNTMNEFTSIFYESDEVLNEAANKPDDFYKEKEKLIVDMAKLSAHVKFKDKDIKKSRLIRGYAFPNIKPAQCLSTFDKLGYTLDKYLVQSRWDSDNIKYTARKKLSDGGEIIANVSFDVRATDIKTGAINILIPLASLGELCTIVRVSYSKKCHIKD
jgi:hypothetical protein